VRLFATTTTTTTTITTTAAAHGDTYIMEEKKIERKWFDRSNKVHFYYWFLRTPQKLRRIAFASLEQQVGGKQQTK